LGKVDGQCLKHVGPLKDSHAGALDVALEFAINTISFGLQTHKHPGRLLPLSLLPKTEVFHRPCQANIECQIDFSPASIRNTGLKMIGIEAAYSQIL